MKLNIKTSTIMMSLFLASHIATAEQNIPVTYKNTRGSTLELQFNQENALTGTFTTAVATKNCQDVIGKKRPIIGYIDGTAITFSVHYPSCGSIVTLTGHITSDKNTIDTIAMIARQNSIFPAGPGTQYITHDTFTKENQESL